MNNTVRRTLVALALAGTALTMSGTAHADDPAPKAPPGHQTKGPKVDSKSSPGHQDKKRKVDTKLLPGHVDKRTEDKHKPPLEYRGTSPELSPQQPGNGQPGNKQPANGQPGNKQPGSPQSPQS